MATDFFPQRPNAHPMIYAYEDTNPQYQGLLKVGYTAIDVDKRVAQQYPTKRPDGSVPYRIVYRESAMYPDGSSFTDHDVHRILKRKQIAGMGGETMIGIMRRGMDVIKHATLILQPNVDPDEVREFLYDNGFCVIDEDLIFDGKWWYFIIKAEPNVKAARPDDDALMIGPVLIKNRHPLLPEYARRQVRILTKALAPMDESLARAAELRHKRAVWEEIANWQQ